jgi:hypothetical protein
VIRRALFVGAGLLSLAGAVIVLAIGAPTSGTVGGLTDALVWLALLAAGLLAVWRLAKGLSVEGYAAPGAAPLVERDPERSQAEVLLSGTDFAETMAEASEVARNTGDVEAALEVVREPLQAVLVEAYRADGVARDRTVAVIEEGSWTDDPVAASVLADDVSGPNRAFRDRLFAWLFTERALRSRVRRAVDEVARVGGRRLPTIPGQTASRNVPVARTPPARLQAGSASALTLEPAPDPDVLEPFAVNPTAEGDDASDARDADGAAEPNGTNGTNETDETDETDEMDGPTAESVLGETDGNPSGGSDR